jgi:voltage-gated potassium channel
VAAAQSSAGLWDTLRHYYGSDTSEAHRFRFSLLAFDLITVAFIVVTSFLARTPVIEWCDVIFGVAILVDFIVRMGLTKSPWRELRHPATWADLAAIASFLAPVIGEGLGFLRILRTVRLLHTYQILRRLRADSFAFRRNEELALATVLILVFLCIMSGVVCETPHNTSPKIANYVDALCFTVTALTTTGFGDITLEGTSGRLISVVIMILGVTLFLNLLQKLLRPSKNRFRCPQCGLLRHDHDAVHC